MPIYLKIKGIPGECQQKDHREWHTVLSFNWGEVNIPVTKGGNGKVTFDEFRITKMSAKGSPLIFHSCANGKPVDEVIVEVTRVHQGAELLFQRYKMTQSYISSYRVADDWETLPIEDLSIAFSRMEYTHIVPNQDGSMGETQIRWWDMYSNKGGSPENGTLG